MAIELTVGVLLGVIVGGVALFLVIATSIIISWQRMRHRRLMAKTEGAGQKRLRGYTGGHMSITDEDVARMPGTRAALRNSLQAARLRASLYEPMTSRDDITPPQMKSVGPNATMSPSPYSGGTMWPLPREPRRSPPYSPIELRPTPPLMTTAARARMLMMGESVAERNAEEVLDSPGEASLISTPSAEKKKTRPPGLVRALSSASNPIAALKPRALFAERLRSVSHDSVAGPRKSTAGGYVLEHEKKSMPSVPHRSGMPRSISLTLQAAGAPPEQGIPALPAEAMALRRQGSRGPVTASQSARVLRGTAWADAVSMLDDNSTLFSNTGTEGKTSSTMLPSRNGPADNQLDVFRDSRRTFDDPDVMHRGSPSQSVKSRTLRAPVDPRKSFRASIRTSIPRSNSSGLSESLLNHGWSRSASNTSLVKDISSMGPRSKSGGADRSKPHFSVFDFGLVPPSGPVDVFASNENDTGDIQRSPTPVLKTISGNEQPPARKKAGLSSATENQSRWSSPTKAKDSTVGTDLNNSGNKHQSMISPSMSPPENYTDEQPDINGLSDSAYRSLRKHRLDPPTFRPPSRATFDPQLTPTHEPGSDKVASANRSPYFQTLARLTGYDIEGNGTPPSTSSSPLSFLSTPTHRPGKPTPSGAHPNRQRHVFNQPSSLPLTQWPLASQHPALSLGLRGSEADSSEATRAGNIFRQDARLNDNDREHDNIVEQTLVAPPPSLLYEFPSPPSPIPVRFTMLPAPAATKDNPTLPSTVNPRLHPTGSQSPRRRGSPVRGHGRAPKGSASGITKPLSWSKLPTSLHAPPHPGDDLRRSVMALRRMNSEVGTDAPPDDFDDTNTTDSGSEVNLQRLRSGAREHQRYLSLGGRMSALFADGTTSDTAASHDHEASATQRDTLDSMDSTTAVVGHPAMTPAGNLSATAAEADEQKKVMGPRAMPGFVNLGGSLMTLNPPAGEDRAGRPPREGAKGGGSWYDQFGFLKS